MTNLFRHIFLFIRKFLLLLCPLIFPFNPCIVFGSFARFNSRVIKFDSSTAQGCDTDEKSW